MSRESQQKAIRRVRRPRVQIEYEVERLESPELVELPFVVGVMADLSGQPKEPQSKLTDRRFVPIDRDNFTRVLADTKPRVSMRVPNRLGDDETELNVELNFA